MIAGGGGAQLRGTATDSTDVIPLLQDRCSQCALAAKSVDNWCQINLCLSVLFR